MLPSSIQIGAHRYDIKAVSKAELEKDTMAYVDNKRNVIRIDEEATRSRQIGSLLHECLHAMLTGFDFRDEERIVVVLEEALTRFLLDNPNFVQQASWILSDEKNNVHPDVDLPQSGC